MPTPDQGGAANAAGSPAMPLISSPFQPKSLVTSSAPAPGDPVALQPTFEEGAAPIKPSPETLGLDLGLALSQLDPQENEELEYAKQHVAHALGWLAAWRSKQAQKAAAERGTPPAAPIDESGEREGPQQGGPAPEPPPPAPATGRSRRAAANSDNQ